MITQQIEDIKNRPPKTVTYPVYLTQTPAAIRGPETLSLGIGPFIGFGIGMCIVGLLIGFVISKMRRNSQTNESE